MAKQAIGIGTSVNDGTGDTIRVAMDKVNDNFTELYAFTADSTIKAKYTYWNNTFSDPPVIAEIETALGITAANADTGCIFQVLDNFTLYSFSSDGTNWYFLKYTEAGQ